jgi:hypothetical protein
MPRDLPFGRVKLNADSAYLNAAVLATSTQPLRLLFAQIVYSTDSGLVEKYRELEGTYFASLEYGSHNLCFQALQIVLITIICDSWHSRFLLSAIQVKPRPLEAL